MRTRSVPQRIRLRALALLLWGLGRLLRRAARVDPLIHAELAPLPVGFCLQLGSLGLARPLILHKQAQGWSTAPATTTLRLTFKHPDVALRVLGLRLGINASFCEGRLSAEGDLVAAMHWVRALEALQAVLLPPRLARPLLRDYQRPPRQLRRALTILAGLLLP